MQVNTDSTSFPVWTAPYLVIDLFNVAGEHIATLDEIADSRVRTGEYEVRWDMVEEMQTWFAWQDVPTLDVKVTVIPKPD